MIRAARHNQREREAKCDARFVRRITSCVALVLLKRERVRRERSLGKGGGEKSKNFESVHDTIENT